MRSAKAPHLRFKASAEVRQLRCATDYISQQTPRGFVALDSVGLLCCQPQVTGEMGTRLENLSLPKH